MGTGSWLHWAILLVVVILIFGTKKLGNVGADIGKAVKGFKDGIKGEDDKAAPAAAPATAKVADQTTIDVEAKEKSKQ